MSNGYVDKVSAVGTVYDIHVPNGTIDRAMLDTDLQEKTDAVDDLKSAIDDIDEELGIGDQPTTYTLPTGYQSANYSNATGTLQFKYVNGNLLCIKENGSFGEVNTTNAGLTIGESLCCAINGTQDYKFHYSYENSNAANLAIIVLRYYADNYSANTSAYVYIPQGTGEQTVDLSDLAEQNNIDLSTHHNVMIRSLSILEAQGATAQNVRVTIDGFGVPVVSENRLEKIESDISDIEDEIEGIESMGYAVIDDTAGEGDTSVTWSADKLSEIKADVDDCADDITELYEQINGSTEPVTYTLPSGYQNANYSNAAGTNKFKYSNGHLELAKSGSAGAITSSNAKLTIDSTLMFDWSVNQGSKVHIEYNNPNAANVAHINFRFYDSSINSNTATLYKLPTGVGSVDVSILDIVRDAENPVTAETKPYVMIRDITLASGAESYSNVSATIFGFSTGGGSTPGLADRVEDLEDKVEDLETEIASLANPENQYEALYEDLGYPDSSTGGLYLYSSTNIEKTSKYIPVTAGETIHYQAWASGDPHGRIAYYNSSKVFVSYEDIPSSNRTSVTGGYYAYLDKTVPSSVAYIRFAYYSFGDGKACVTRSSMKTNWIPALADMGSKVYNTADKFELKGINHRGYNTVAPENTIPAFVMSAQEGFDIVETDVQFTSDNVPVLLHDTTINRTARNADGTELSSDVAINSITFTQSQEYDFGIWKDASYAGTKLPKFEDFVVLCKRIGLHPYIELKNDVQYTESQLLILVSIVKKYGMENSCTWISFALTPLAVVKRNLPGARLGYIVSTITDKRIIETKFLKTQYNETFLDANISNLTSELLGLTKSGGVTLEVYSINTEQGMLELDEYISGCTSDVYNFQKVVRESIVGT